MWMLENSDTLGCFSCIHICYTVIFVAYVNILEGNIICVMCRFDELSDRVSNICYFSSGFSKIASCAINNQ